MEPAQAARQPGARLVASGPVIELDPALKEKLRAQRVTINVPDANTIVLESVPTALLDAAAARAHLMGASDVRLEDVYLAALQFGDESGGGPADQIPS